MTLSDTSEQPGNLHVDSVASAGKGLAGVAPMPAQFGIADSADFEAGTWTFEMQSGYKVAAGPFAIVPRATYDELLAALNAFVSPWSGDTLAQIERESGLATSVRIEQARAAIAKATGAAS